jgi:hypothetical protein
MEATGISSGLLAIVSLSLALHDISIRFNAFIFLSHDIASTDFDMAFPQIVAKRKIAVFLTPTTSYGSATQHANLERGL